MKMRSGIARRAPGLGLLAVTLMVVLCGALALAPPVLGQAPQRGGTLVLGIEADPDVIDPHVGTGWVIRFPRSRCHPAHGLASSSTNSGKASILARC